MESSEGPFTLFRRGSWPIIFNLVFECAGGLAQPLPSKVESWYFAKAHPYGIN
jgi:hypothetical protein